MVEYLGADIGCLKGQPNEVLLGDGNAQTIVYFATSMFSDTQGNWHGNYRFVTINPFTAALF